MALLSLSCMGALVANAVLISSGPLRTVPDGKDAQHGLTRRLVRPRGARRGTVPRPGGWRRSRRPRPRLSHKGPMPF